MREGVSESGDIRITHVSFVFPAPAVSFVSSCSDHNTGKPTNSMKPEDA